MDKRFLKFADKVVIFLSVLVVVLSSGGIIKGCLAMCRRTERTEPVEIEAPAEAQRLYYLTDDVRDYGDLEPVEPQRQLPAPEEPKEPERTYLGRFYVTGYDICVKCCGKTDGITASGTQAKLGRTCAAGPELPFGTVLYIDGIGERVVEDRGTGVTEGCLDVLCEDHAECYAITGWYDVYIVGEQRNDTPTQPAADAGRIEEG